MIMLLGGPVGSGKTLHAVEIVADYLCDGAHVWTSIKLKWPGMLQLCAERWGVVPSEAQYHWVDPETLDATQLFLSMGAGESEAHPHLLMLDECGILFPVRGWKKNEEKFGEFMAWVAQSRKDHIDIGIIVQNPDSVDSLILRQLAGQFAIMHMVLWSLPGLRWMKRLGNFGHLIIATTHKFNPSGKMEGKGITAGRVRRPSICVYRAYDTDQRHTQSALGCQKIPRATKLPRASFRAGWAGIGRMAILPACVLALATVLGCRSRAEKKLADTVARYNSLTGQVSLVLADLRAKVAVVDATNLVRAVYSDSSASFDSGKYRRTPGTNTNPRIPILCVSGRWQDAYGRYHISVDDEPDLVPGSVYPDGRMIKKITANFIVFSDNSAAWVRVGLRSDPATIGARSSVASVPTVDLSKEGGI